MRRPTQPGVLDVSRSGEGCRRPFAERLPYPQREPRVPLGGALKLDQQLRGLVARQQPEEEPLGQPERAHIGRPPQLEQPPVLKDRSRLLPPEGFGRARPNEVAPPQPCIPLLAGDRVRGSVVENGLAKCGEQFRITGRFRRRLGEGAVLDGGTGGFQEPRERQPMGGGQLQEVAPVGRSREAADAKRAQTYPWPGR